MNPESPVSYLLVLLLVLVVVIGFQRELRPAVDALEASSVEECEIFERTDPIHLVDDFLASKTSGFVKVWSIHFA